MTQLQNMVIEIVRMRQVLKDKTRSVNPNPRSDRNTHLVDDGFLEGISCNPLH
jgi:hypothetical protein